MLRGIAGLSALRTISPSAVGNRAMSRLVSGPGASTREGSRGLARSPGQPLDDTTRRSMERSFGHDFGDVRVHTDARATGAARAAGAVAYTTGADIHVDREEFAPATPEGRRLLAHELAHVVQQGAAQPLRRQALARQPGGLEHEADRASEAAAAGRPAHVSLSAPFGEAQPWFMCMWHMWRFSDLIESCNREFREAGCDTDLVSDSCQNFMDGAGWPSESILRCVGRKNPEAMAKLLSSCASSSLGQLLSR